MTDNDFLTEVRSAFGYLEAHHGFRLVHYEPPRVFDNTYADFASPVLSVRVGRERGQSFVEVGSALGGRRYDGHLLARLLDDAELERRAEAGDAKVRELGQAVAPHLNRLVVLFGAAARPETEARLEALGTARAEERFGPIGPP